MKAKDKENLTNLSIDELQSELRQAREKKMRLLFKHETAPLENPLELRELRRRVARIKTYIGEQTRAEAKK